MRLGFSSVMAFVLSAAACAQEQLPEAGLRFELPHNWHLASRSGPQQAQQEAVLYVYERDALPGAPTNCTVAFLVRQVSDGVGLRDLLGTYPPQQQLQLADSLSATHASNPLLFLQSVLLKGTQPDKPELTVWLAYVIYKDVAVIIRLAAPSSLMDAVRGEFTTILRTLR